jgi:hypothetical protein
MRILLTAVESTGLNNLLGFFFLEIMGGVIGCDGIRDKQEVQMRGNVWWDLTGV